MNVHLAENWAQELAVDCANAAYGITISSLSMQPPRHPSLTDFGILWQSWVDATRRGVRVEFFLASPSKSHPATARNASAGALAFQAGMHVRYVPQPNLMHAKSIIIDDKTVWIGSGNMTAAAAHHNHEIYVRFEAPEIAARIKKRWESIANHE